MILRSLDQWRCAIVSPTNGTIEQRDLVAENLVWLPPTTSATFRADPFGIWCSGTLHVFVEFFDYRRPKGIIECHSFDRHLRPIDSAVVLERPWHLSYPYTFEAEGAYWMLPEARQSGRLTLYRADSFPNGWYEAAVIEIDASAVDATPLFFEGRWWVFYARGARKAPASMELNVAFADSLAGPWSAHALNPVRKGWRTRPAGTPTVSEQGCIELPVQDSEATYGARVRRLRINRLEPHRFEAEEFAWLEPSEALAPFTDGLHTISRANELALIDCKRVDRSLAANVAWRRGRLREHYGF